MGRLAAAGLLALAVWAPAPSSAQTQGSWSWNVGNPTTVERSIRVAGEVSVQGIGNPNILRLKVGWEPANGSNVAEDCRGETLQPERVEPPFGQPSSHRYFEFSVQPWCNGPQAFYATASACPWDAGNKRCAGSEYADAWPVGRVDVALPSPPVSDVRATLTPERTINVSWSAPEGYKLPQSNGSDESTSTTEGEEAKADPPDFVGYRVERVVGEGEPEQLGDDVITDTRYVDKKVPKEGSKVTYRVIALRRTAPDSEELVASEPTSKTLTIAGPASSTTVQSTTTTTRRSRVGFVRRRTSSRPKTTTTQPKVLGEITGPADGLPDEEPGEVDPELPDDNLASDALLESDRTTPWEDRALLVPVAAGLALMVFALQIRYITRRAARAEALAEFRPA